jgi:hypothetical protein
MSTLNQIEIEVLTRLAMKPRDQKSLNRDYKRRSRERAKQLSKNGKLAFNAESSNLSILDAMADAIRNGNTSATVADIVAMASTRFPVPAIAEAAIRARLAARKVTQAASNG